MSIKHERQKTIYLYKNSQNLKLKINSEIMLTLIELKLKFYNKTKHTGNTRGWKWVVFLRVVCVVNINCFFMD